MTPTTTTTVTSTLNPNLVPTFSAGGSPDAEWGRANALLTAQFQAAQHNTVNQFRFDQACISYNAQMSTGTTADLAKPAPPFKWVAEDAAKDAAGNVIGWPAAVESTTEHLPFNVPLSTFNASTPTPTPPPNNISIGSQIGSSVWYHANPDDTVPYGKTVMGPDGRWYEKWSNAWGGKALGMYEVVAAPQ